MSLRVRMWGGGKAEVFSEKKPPFGGYRPLFAVKAAALRFNAKAIAIAAFKLKRFEPTLGLVPFGGECALILPLKVGAEKNKGANCS